MKEESSSILESHIVIELELTRTAYYVRWISALLLQWAIYSYGMQPVWVEVVEGTVTCIYVN